MLTSFSAWLTKPFREEVELGTLIAIIAAYAVLVWIVLDVLNLIKEFAQDAI